MIFRSLSIWLMTSLFNVCVFHTNDSFDFLLQNHKCTYSLTSLTCSNLNETDILTVYLKLNITNVVNKLEELSITHSMLTSISDLPSFPALKKLDLSHNKIELLSNPRQMVMRDVSVFMATNNSLKFLSHDAFSAFPNLEEVHLNFNKIMSIDWEAFRLFRLKVLNLSNNYLPTVSVHMLRFTNNLEILDMSHNQLTLIQSSSIHPATKLHTLNLSFNRIQYFKYDSFTALNQVTFLDLSFNNLSVLPTIDIKQMVGLKCLNLSGNPLNNVAVGDLDLPFLENLVINDIPTLRLLEAGSMYGLPKLKRLSAENNTNLIYLSSKMFSNNSRLDEINLKNNALQFIPRSLFETCTTIAIKGNPLKCDCMARTLDEFASKIIDHRAAICTPGSCVTNAILPFGNHLEAMIGSCFSIYCALPMSPTSIAWKLPNGSHVPVTAPTFLTSESTISNADISLFSALLPDHNFFRHKHITEPILRQKPRISAFQEKLQIDSVFPNDAGVYQCTDTSTRVETSLLVSVKIPYILIEPIEVGSHFAMIAWNDTLRICDFHRVSSYLTVQDSERATRRSTRLSMHNSLKTYNIMRLKPFSNYTICLLYVFNDNGESREIFQTCTEVQTQCSQSFWNALNVTALIVILGGPIIICIVLGLKTVQAKMYIKHDNIQRARMNQSISGQSFLSHSSSVAEHSLSLALSNSRSNNGIQLTPMSLLWPLSEETECPMNYQNNDAV